MPHPLRRVFISHELPLDMIPRAPSPVTPRGQADERAEREWSSGADGEHLAGAGAATSLLVSSSSDGDMLLQVGC